MPTKLLNQIYRIPRLIVRLCLSAILARRTLRFRGQVAFFTDGMHFQEKTPEGLILSKADYWLRVLDEVGIHSDTILNPFSVGPRNKAARPLLFIEFFYLVGVIDLTIHKRWKWAVNECDPSYQIPRSFRNKVRVQIYYEFLRKKKYKLIAGIALPQEVCIVASYLKLPTYEFQHGATPPKELLDFGNSWVSPNYLFVWDEHYSKGYPNEKSLINIGYPKDFSGQKLSSKHLKDKRPLKILVSLSYSESDPADPTGLLNNALCEPIQSVIRDGHEVYLRFHPSVFTGLEISRLDSKIVKRFLTWKLKHDFLQHAKIDKHENLFDSLANADIQFTYASSTVLEAAYSGVPSVIFSNKEKFPNIPSSLYLDSTVIHSTGHFCLDQLIGKLKVSSFGNTPNRQRFLEIVNKNL